MVLSFVKYFFCIYEDVMSFLSFINKISYVIWFGVLLIFFKFCFIHVLLTNLSCTMWHFDTCISCVISRVQLMNISFSSQSYLFCCCWEHFRWILDLDQPRIPGIFPIWTWCIIHFLCFWIRFDNSMLKLLNL